MAKKTNKSEKVPEKEKKPFLERVGVSFFKRLNDKNPPSVNMDKIHVLNTHERERLRKVMRNTVLRAGLAGALSATIAAAVGLLALPLLGPDPDNPAWGPFINYWLVVGGITLIATTIEVAFLYRDALLSVFKLTHTAGLTLFKEGEDDSKVALYLVRAALEIPSPHDEDNDVNPRKEASKLWLILATLLYKAKATLTNFLIKALVRRMLGRAAGRTVLEFVGVPVYAFWNGLISWWIIREARIRCMGPSAVEEFTDVFYKDKETFTEEGKIAIFRAIGSSIVKSVDLHPNLHILLEVTRRKLGDPQDDVVIDSPDLFLEQIPSLNKKEQDVVLSILYLSAIIDGRIKSKEKAFIFEAQERAGQPTDIQKVKNLRSAFMKGDPISDPDLEALVAS